VTSPFGAPAEAVSGIMRRMNDPEIKPEAPETLSPVRRALLALAAVGAVAILFFGVRRALGPAAVSERLRCHSDADCGAMNCPDTPKCQGVIGEEVCWCVGKHDVPFLKPGIVATSSAPPTWWTCAEWVRPKVLRPIDAGPLDGACAREPVLVVVPPDNGSSYAQYLATKKYGGHRSVPPGYESVNIFCHEGRDPGLDPNAPPPKPDGGLKCE